GFGKLFDQLFSLGLQCLALNLELVPSARNVVEPTTYRPRSFGCQFFAALEFHLETLALCHEPRALDGDFGQPACHVVALASQVSLVRTDHGHGPFVMVACTPSSRSIRDSGVFVRSTPGETK